MFVHPGQGPVKGRNRPGANLLVVTYVDDPRLEEEPEEDESLSEDLANLAPPVLDPADAKFVSMLVDRVWEFTVMFSGVEMFPYQAALGRRIIESVISCDGATITGELSRQVGQDRGGGQCGRRPS